MLESFLLRKVYQIIAVMDSGGSNTTASYMPILIWIHGGFLERVYESELDTKTGYEGF
jgi:hypothetical protein